LRSLPVKAFVVRFHVSRCPARVWPGELMPRTRSPRRPGADDQALDMARSGRQLRRPVPGLSSAYTRN
jgi:hypothetical protein